MTALSTASVTPARPPAAGWQAFVQHARTVTASTVLTPVSQAPQVDSLPSAQAVPLTRAVLLVPRQPEAGLARSIQDLTSYLKAVTGKPVEQLVYDRSRPIDLSRVPAGASVVAIGDGTRINGLVPAGSGQPQGYSIQASTYRTGGRQIPVVGINGDDLLGREYGIYRLMSLSGKRFYEYDDSYTPPVGTAKLPASGFGETHAPPPNMAVRGFAPHEYHPTPLTLAFHEPSAAHLAEIQKYLDWCVANGQNNVKFELLNLDSRSRLLPIVPNHDKFQAWLPYARQILDYAHARGLKVSINVAFSEDVSNNEFAVNPFKAIAQSLRLDPKERAAAKGGKASQDYAKALARASASDARDIRALVDRLMQAPWDDISWCLGTSEFSGPNDDLTIAWMNEAATYTKQRYPGTTSTVISHVPDVPYSQKYQEPFFNLANKTDPAMGEMVHTTEIYSFTDPAPVYGNQSFEHKLKQLYDADPKRRTVYLPETSYWVSYDASVPLFLPIYMASRARDMAVIKDLPNIKGEMTFTTAWEWGYWLTDYAVARMQANPNESLTSILMGAFEPFGRAQKPAVNLMQDAMAAQQHFLIDQGLIKELKGFDSLIDFGDTLQHVPGLNKLIQGTNSEPVRTRPADIMKFSAAQLADFQSRELVQLARMAERFEALAKRANALRGQVPDSSRAYFDELADGLEMNALRAQEVLAALTAAADAREEKLTGKGSWRDRGLQQLAKAKSAMSQAMQVIQQREQHYRTPADETYGTAKGPTLWNNRYLTPVHTGEYWKNTYNEVAKLYQ